MLSGIELKTLKYSSVTLRQRMKVVRGSLERVVQSEEGAVIGLEDYNVLLSYISECNTAVEALGPLIDEITEARMKLESLHVDKAEVLAAQVKDDISRLGSMSHTIKALEGKQAQISSSYWDLVRKNEMLSIKVGEMENSTEEQRRRLEDEIHARTLEGEKKDNEIQRLGTVIESYKLNFVNQKKKIEEQDALLAKKDREIETLNMQLEKLNSEYLDYMANSEKRMSNVKRIYSSQVSQSMTSDRSYNVSDTEHSEHSEFILPTASISMPFNETQRRTISDILCGVTPVSERLLELAANHTSVLPKIGSVAPPPSGRRAKELNENARQAVEQEELLAARLRRLKSIKKN